MWTPFYGASCSRIVVLLTIKVTTCKLKLIRDIGSIARVFRQIDTFYPAMTYTHVTRDDVSKLALKCLTP